MKNLLMSLSVMLFSVTVFANEQKQFLCQNDQHQAFLTVSNLVQFRQSTSRECNGGVGDDYTDCRDVAYNYEDSSVWIQFDQDTVSFAVTRILPRQLFTGRTSDVVLTSERDSYALSVKTPTGWAFLLCKAVSR